MSHIIHNNRKRGPGFNKDFTIPKKQFKEDCQNQNNTEYQRSESLNNAYDDYQPNFQRYGSQGPPNTFHQSNNFHNNTSYPSSDYDNFGNYPPPDIPFDQRFRGNQNFQQDAAAVQNHHKEVPKTGFSGAPVRYQDTFPHISDPSLPKELTEQFQPLYCKLCAAQLSSNVMAKLHYKSKNHEKKIRKFLAEYSERTGEPLHERAKVANCKKQKPDEDNNPKYFHCDVCDLPLTGRLHAESHYMGKNHHKALAGKAPAGKGHYDGEGNWIRTAPSVPSERDNFGTDFAQGDDSTNDKEIKGRNLQCELCGVCVTSEQQMAMHVSGQRHKKKVEQQVKEKEDENKIVKPGDSILSSLSCSNISSTDLSVYRTPTGYYYCNPCNVSLNSETQFKQHLGSKKHRKKASINKE